MPRETMIVIIIKIHPVTNSKTKPGEKYRLMEFVDAYDPEIKYLTYLNPGNGNYDNWKNLRVGDVIAEVELKDKEKGLIDADSQPKFIKNKSITTQGDLFNDNKC